jgi:outer membrane receptor protein involved in Fe transport
MKTEVVSSTHPDGINIGNTGVRVPRYTGGGGLEISPLPRLDLSLIATYDDGMRNRTLDTRTGEETVTIYSSYTRVNFAADYRISRMFSTELRVENLLDQDQFGSSYETIGPDGYSRTETRSENPGRFISLGLTMSF